MAALKELLSHHGLTEEDCKKPVSDLHLSSISLKCCKDWRLLPSLLGLESIVSSDVERKPTAVDEREKRYEFLKEWKQRKGYEATYRNLILALVEIDCKEDAGRVCDIMKEKRVI